MMASNMSLLLTTAQPALAGLVHAAAAVTSATSTAPMGVAVGGVGAAIAAAAATIAPSPGTGHAAGHAPGPPPAHAPGAGHAHGLDILSSDGVSPVTLTDDWSRVARLLLLATLSVVGSVGNVFMISAIMIEDHLNKRGNSFIVNMALADMLITGFVFPASTIVILSGQKDTEGVCSFQWQVSLVSCLVTVLTLAAIATENFARLCLSPACYEWLTPTRITILMILIWLASIAVVSIQMTFDLGPDYCHRRFAGVLPYRVTVAAVYVFVPASITFVCYLLIILRVHSAKAQSSFKPPVAFSWDFSLMKTNMYSFLLFVIFWMPFGVILGIGSIQTVSARIFYNLAWFALSKSCVNNFLYCVTNRHFRNAYVNLFHYCCCKTTVALTRRPRGEVSRPSGDVRVHIIPGYNMYSYTSPQRAGAREMTSSAKPAAKRAAPAMNRPNGHGGGHGRDVYEL